MASWINNLGYPEDKLVSKKLFYNSESILNKNNILEHFKKENRGKFEDKNIQFMCKKGTKNPVNQDNFFVIVEKRIKFMAVFDGHGLNGHLMSRFAMGAMAKFIQNSRKFNQKDIEEMSNEEMTKAIRKCFRYTQDQAKEQYRSYLINKKREQRRTALIQHNQDQQVSAEEANEDERYVDECSVSVSTDEEELIEHMSWDTDSDVEDLEYDERVLLNVDEELSEGSRDGQ